MSFLQVRRMCTILLAAYLFASLWRLYSSKRPVTRQMVGSSSTVMPLVVADIYGIVGNGHVADAAHLIKSDALNDARENIRQSHQQRLRARTSS